MPALDRRCHELRIVGERATGGSYRVDHDAIVIAEVFSKKTPATPRSVLDASRRRFRVYDASWAEDERSGRGYLPAGAAGWRPGDAADFLELTPEEAAFVELKLALGDYLRRLRTENSLTRRGGRAAWLQPVARRQMEAADASVSVDLLVRSLLALGASRQQVGGVIARAA